MREPIPLCKHCVHAHRDIVWGHSFGRCDLYMSPSGDGHGYSEMARKHSGCGLEGKWFERRPSLVYRVLNFLFGDRSPIHGRLK